MENNFFKILFGSLIVMACSCNDNITVDPILTDNFDRAEMLQFWADDIIIPAYETYRNAVIVLNTETENFYTEPDSRQLNNLRAAWLNAYLAWQRSSIFEIGKAEEIGLRNFTNIYPADIDLIRSNISDGNYNLELPSNFAAQGFPALDYLLYGLGSSDEEIVYALSSSKTKVYFSDLVERLNSLSFSVLEDWNLGFRDAFIANDGSSGTASTDKLVNDFLFYYEKYLRAAKVGIPAGVFSGNEEPTLVEGRYSQIYSKQLFKQGFEAVQDFFKGQSSKNSTQGISLNQYLNDIKEANKSDLDISSMILSHWSNVDNALENVDDNFEKQISEDNAKMLIIYDELQKAIVPLKVDMLQALNIQVDFVDADGD